MGGHHRGSCDPWLVYLLLSTVMFSIRMYSPADSFLYVINLCAGVGGGVGGGVGVGVGVGVTIELGVSDEMRGISVIELEKESYIHIHIIGTCITRD